MRPWSYSRYITARECLYRYWLQYVNQYPSTPTEAMQRGTRLHKAFADLIQGKDVEMSEDEREAFRSVEKFTKGAQAEVEYAVDENMNPCTEDAFMLGHLDIVKTGPCVNVIDWKMGQSLVFDRVQMDFYAVLYAAHNDSGPVLTSFIFPFLNASISETYTSEDIDVVKNEIKNQLLEQEAEISLLDQDDPEQWEPHVGKHCGSCLQWHRCGFYNRGLSWNVA